MFNHHFNANQMRLYIEAIDAMSAQQLDEAIAKLPAWRRERALAYRHEQGRKECAMSYLLLCRALREVYGIEWQPSFAIGEHGKPELALPQEGLGDASLKDAHGDASLRGALGDASLKGALGGTSLEEPHPFSSFPHFNMSHCKKAVACVVADAEVGVDIERLGRFSEAMARHVLNEEEYAEVMAADDPDVVFTDYWTKKEAIVKLTGRGIDDDLKNIIAKYKHVRLRTERHVAEGFVVTVASF